LNIPDTLRAGDTISWTESISDYPASDGWTLAFALRAKDLPPITITASTSGSDYAIAITAPTSKAYNPGIYSWQAYVSKGTSPDFTEKYSIEMGRIEILPNLTIATSETELRSHAKKVLDAIEALLEGKAGADVLSYSIGGRSISKMAPEELIKWRSFYKTEYERELEAEAIAKGLDSPRRIGVRFRRL
jgi:hypothetical protein